MFLFLLLGVAQAAMRMEQSDWVFLQSHPIKNVQHLDQNRLNELVHSEWLNMVSHCPSLDKHASINAYFDDSLIGTSTLAWASQTMYLKYDGIFYPALSNMFYSGYDFTIGVNPEPPNGWFDGDCKDISYRYDLRSVIRHEILHGIGLGSSISYDNDWDVGHIQNGLCFPRLYDTLITDIDGNKVVDRCDIVDITSKRLFLGDVELYHPDEFNQGSSLAHHNYPGKLFYYRTTPMQCMYMSKYEISMLSSLGLHCFEDGRSQGTKILSSNLVFLLILFVGTCLLH